MIIAEKLDCTSDSTFGASPSKPINFDRKSEIRFTCLTITSQVSGSERSVSLLSLGDCCRNRDKKNDVVHFGVFTGSSYLFAS